MDKKEGNLLQRLAKGIAKARDKKLTIMLIPESSEKVRQVRIPMLGIYMTSAVLVVVIAVTAYIYSSAGDLRASLYHERTERKRQVHENTVLIEENSKKDSAFNELYKETETLKTKMGELQDLSEQINALMRKAGQPIIRSRTPLSSRGGVQDRAVPQSSAISAPAYAGGGFASIARSVGTKDSEMDRIAGIERNITHLQETTPEQEQQLRDLKATLEEYNRRLDHTPSIWPVRGWLTSSFGSRIHPISGRRVFHEGMDIAVPSRTPVRAGADGKVIWAGYRGGYGLAVIIEHGYGLKTLYGHNSKLVVSAGQKVKKGQIICYSGNSGSSTGPHLHYEIQVNGSSVNPLRYLP